MTHRKRAMILAVVAMVLMEVESVPARADVEEIIRDVDGISGFELHGPGLYWWSRSLTCSEFEHPGTVRLLGLREPMHYWKHVARDCDILQSDVTSNTVRDNTYVYFFRGGRLHRKPVYYDDDDPSEQVHVADLFEFNPTILASGVKDAILEIADGYIYWSRLLSDGSSDFYRMKLDGGEKPVKLFSASVYPGRVKKLRVARYTITSGDEHNDIVWLTENGDLVRKALPAPGLPKGAIGPAPGPGGAILRIESGVVDFDIHTRTVFNFFTRQTTRTTYVFAAKEKSLQRIDIENSNENDTIYQVRDDRQLISVTSDTDSFVATAGPEGEYVKNIYIAEARALCAGDTCLGQDVLIKRHTLPGLTSGWDLIVATDAGSNLRSDDEWLYFADGHSIQRIETDAPALEINVRAIDLEVVQAVQGTGNGHITPLVAHKPTYVRAYAYLQKNTTGVEPWRPEGLLYGTRDGQDLPGSPLSSLENPGLDGTNDLPTLKASVDGGYLFRLPDSWTESNSGQFETTGVRFVVNGDGSVPETDPDPASDNEIGRSVRFKDKIRPCLVLNPIWTLPTLHYAPHDPGFRRVFRRAESLFPVERFKIYYREDPVVLPVLVIEPTCPYPPFFGCPRIEEQPFDMSEDEDLAMLHLTLRNMWNSDPPGCPDTHWVGMVHWNEPGFNGKAGRPQDGAPDLAHIRTLLVRFEPGAAANNPWDSTMGGRTLAHELAHNYGRMHVLQDVNTCGGGTPEDTDSSYPYNGCSIGWGADSSIWGFDTITETPIPPNMAADLMSYADSRWVSDWTWLKLFAEAPDDKALEKGLPASSPVVLVQGLIFPEVGSAEFGAFYQMAAGSFDEQKVMDSLVFAGDATSPYSMRFLGIDGTVLGKSPVVPLPGDDGTPGGPLGFAQFLPWPGGTGSIQLLDGDRVMEEKVLSASAPTLTLGAPLLEEASGLLSLSWDARDADDDALTFAIHYSPDDGQSWQNVRLSYPATEITIATRYLPGTDVARVRVVATDGVRTASAISGRFVVPRHAPEVAIAGVTDGEIVPFGETRELGGSVMDAEDGSLDGEQLDWLLTGPVSRGGGGSHLFLTDLVPGQYTVELDAIDNDVELGSAVVDFEVGPVEIRDGPTPKLDGLPNDAIYSDAAFIRLPLADGKSARAWLAHADGALHVCVSGLPASPAHTNIIGLAVDRDASGGDAPGAGEVGFFVDESGNPLQTVGDGTSMIRNPMPSNSFEAIVLPGNESWNAELRIAEELVGGWDHLARILLTSNPLGLVAFEPGGAGIGNPPGSGLRWPPAGASGVPSSWALASLGEAPGIGNRSPVADAGPIQVINVTSSEQVVSLDGSLSSDPDGDELSFSWVQTAGPPVLLEKALTASPLVTVDPVDFVTVVSFQVSVSDGALRSVDTTAVALLPARRPGMEKPTATFRRGDGNDDGAVDISDPIFSLEHQFLGRGAPGCLAALDTNGDTTLDISDPIYNLEYQFLGKPAPPPPYPGCGPESLPEELALSCDRPPENCP